MPSRPSAGADAALPESAAMVLDLDGLDRLIAALGQVGFQVLAPRVGDGAVALEPIDGADDLPIGWHADLAPGAARLQQHAGDGLVFDTVLPAEGWKRHLYPPRRRLWQATRPADGGADWTVAPTDGEPAPPTAFLAVRACELAAIGVQDRVFLEGPFADADYQERRRNSFLIVVNCGRAAETCFCASMGTGPRAESGYDLALTEIPQDGRPRFLVEIGSARGRAALADLDAAPATDADRAAAAAATARATAQMDPAAGGCAMVADVADLLRRNLESGHWDRVGERCLGCANCTLVCPTCFCATVEDETTLDGATASRWRRWDSCFSIAFSYMHGGSVRRELPSRYRQWMTHKLAHWHDQFGVSGCVGCGRCIAWCPVGIDITAEARAIADSEGG